MYDLLTLWEHDVSNDIISGDTVELQKQINMGWDINMPIAKYVLQGIEKFPVMLAIQYSNFKSLDFLIEHGAKLDIDNSHAFLYALRYSDQFLDYLLKKGAKVNVYGKAYNAYDVVTSTDKLHLIPTIVKAKLPLHPYAVNACFSAIYNTQYNLIDAFIKHGFDLNNNKKSKFNLHGNTSLSHAALYTNCNMLEYLIKRGANPSITNSLGKTPYILAKEIGKINNAEYLRQFNNNNCIHRITKDLPSDILVFVREMDLRLYLPDSSEIKFIDFLPESELYPVSINKQNHIMLTEKVDFYPDISLLWNVKKNCLAYYESEHGWYGNFKVAFKDFLLDPQIYINGIFTNKFVD